MIVAELFDRVIGEQMFCVVIFGVNGVYVFDGSFVEKEVNIYFLCETIFESV